MGNFHVNEIERATLGAHDSAVNVFQNFLPIRWGRKNPLSVFFNTPFVILEFLLHMLYILHRTYDHTDIRSVGSNAPGNWLLLHKTPTAIYIYSLASGHT